MSPTDPDDLRLRPRRRDRAKLADKKTFPNLTKIVVAGHSAGGQFATRYEMANKVHDTPGVSHQLCRRQSVELRVAGRRASAADGQRRSRRRRQGSARPERREGATRTSPYGPFDATKAPNYNQWPAGLENRTGYTAGMTDDQLKKQLVERPTTYLLGQVDVLPLGGFDSSPNAMAQGPTRRARGEAFFKYVNETLGAKHQAIIVPECGHNDRCIFTTDLVFPVIFPK